MLTSFNASAVSYVHALATFSTVYPPPPNKSKGMLKLLT